MVLVQLADTQVPYSFLYKCQLCSCLAVPGAGPSSFVLDQIIHWGWSLSMRMILKLLMLISGTSVTVFRPSCMFCKKFLHWEEGNLSEKEISKALVAFLNR